MTNNRSRAPPARLCRLRAQNAAVSHKLTQSPPLFACTVIRTHLYQGLWPQRRIRASKNQTRAAVDVTYALHRKVMSRNPKNTGAPRGEHRCVAVICCRQMFKHTGIRSFLRSRLQLHCCRITTSAPKPAGGSICGYARTTAYKS